MNSCRFENTSFFITARYEWKIEIVIEWSIMGMVILVCNFVEIECNGRTNFQILETDT